MFDIYAPLGHRLGIGLIKWELEDLSFRYLHTSAYKKIAKLLDEKLLDRDEFIRRMTDNLKLELDNAGTGEYTLHSIEATSGDWDLSGVRLGGTMASVQKRFGTRGRHVEKHGREIYWLYEMSEENPGSSNFFFRDGKLFKIQSVYQLC